jgi:hypothetical protein
MPSYAPPKSRESHMWDKNHLDVVLVENYKVYYEGEGGRFPQVWAMVSLVCSRLFVVHPSTKSAPTMH